MLFTIAIAYFLLVVAVALLQRRLIYFPTRLPPDFALRAASDRGLVPWRNRADQIIGWKMPARGGAPIGSVLVVHGNAGSALDRQYFAQPIHEAASVDVYIMEYPGYGSRDGSPGLQSLLAAADEAFDVLPTGGPIYVVGESLGAGVAAHVARAQREKVAGLVLFMPFDNLVAVAQSKMPFLPVSLLLRDAFAPDVWLSDYRGPVKFVLAEADEVIPARFGRRLYDGYGGPKNLQVIAGARHNDGADQPPGWWKMTFLFLEQHKQAGAGIP